jgi:acyl-coenzyme A synthetase/AMP-(fatty) acid ligase
MEQPPNMKSYAKEYRDFALSVPEYFSFPLDVFDRWGERTALFWTDGILDRKFTFNEMKLLSSKCAGAFRKADIARGYKVLVMLPNIPEWWEVMLGIMRLNAVPITATTLLTEEDIGYRLSATDIKAIIATEEDAPKITAAVNNASVSPLLFSIGGSTGWLDFKKLRDAAEPFEGERALSSDPALIYFTSGTTGHPKMVLHSHASYPLAHLTTGRYWLDLRPGDLHWNLSDTGWAKAAWSSLFGPWHMGAAIFSFHKRGKFDPSAIIEVMRKYPITTFCGPPTAYRMMVKELSSASSIATKSLRHFVAAGEPLNREVIEIWKAVTGHYIYDGYGQTETVNVLANFRCLPVKPGSMGKPVPGFIVDTVDEKGNPAPTGTEGDIALKIKPDRPVGLFTEYLGNKEATESTVRGEWYVTGDRAYQDNDGYFWFVGRADDVILTSGYRIGPFEIESILIEHPAVKESAVVASPDEVRGEVVKAFVVLTKDYAPSDRLIRELQDLVKMRTAPYKYPRKITFVDELPKTVSGKIRRKELKIREFQTEKH